MTLSLEQQILEAMRVAIDGEPKGPLVRPEGLTVDRSRLLEVKPTTTHVSVYPMVAGDEPIGLQAKATLDAKVAIWGKGVAGRPIDEALDSTWQWVCQQLFADPSLGGLATTLTNTRRVYGFAQHLGPFGDLDLHFTVTYRHSPTNPAAN